MSLKIVKTLALDFTREAPLEYIFVKAGDKDSRILDITPLNSGLAFAIPADTKVVFVAKKPDKTEVFNEAKVNTETGHIEVTLSEQTLAAEGVIVCEVGLYSSVGEFLSSQHFYLKAGPFALTDVESSNEYAALVVALLAVDAKVREAEQIIEEMEKAKENGYFDNALSEDSENAVQNKIVAAEFKKINDQIADILYTPITINSFTVTPSTAEIGSTVSKVALAWSLNKTPEALTLDGEDQTGNGAELTNLAITANKSWTLKATDERGATAEKSATLSFLNGVYYGVSAEPEAYDSAFILGLTKNLRSSKLTSISVNAGAGQYIFYCLPKRFGTCSFTVGGFSGGFSLVATMQFENASGYTEEYYIYKSDNAELGSTKVTIA